jgi:acyl-coenzyme A thioesterase PaaI-like protein
MSEGSASVSEALTPEQPLASALPLAATREAVGALDAVLADDRERHRRQEGQLAHGAVAAAEGARAAGAAAHREALETHGEALLEHGDIAPLKLADGNTVAVEHGADVMWMHGIENKRQNA